MGSFELHSEYAPTGDQPQAIAELASGLKKGYREQTLLGVTGSGKTFTMARIIQELQRPVLVMAPNKTLAGQLYNEFKQFFPNNAVEYFISYYDYYQPEAYVPQSDTYIEKDSSINDEIDKLRHSATAAVLERRAFTGWVHRMTTTRWPCPCAPGPNWAATTCCAAWSRSSMSAMSIPFTAEPSGCGGML